MMKKRMTAGMLATLMAAVLPVSACAAQNSAPQPQLNTAEHMQYMNGYTDGTFRPDASITRAEASKLLTSLLVDWGEHRDYLFSDVSVSAWYANAVCQMINFGLVNGYTDGTFKPNAKITRAEFVAILSRFPHTDIGTDKSFADVPKTNWAYNAVQTALAQGWISAGTAVRRMSLRSIRVRASVLCRMCRTRTGHTGICLRQPLTISLTSRAAPKSGLRSIRRLPI